MTEAALRAIFGGLNAAGVAYLVVGGLAVNAHGFVRTTKDVDIILNFEPENLRKGLAFLKSLGYAPKVPVNIEDFADASNRETWIRDKHMLVFGLRSPIYKETDIDIFVNDPLGFEDAHKRGFHQRLELGLLDPQQDARQPVNGGSEDAIDIPFCSFDDLIKLKLEAGRHRDLDDIEQLQIIRGTP